MSFTYEYPRPALSADAIVFAKDGDVLKVLLIQRKHPPYQKDWAIPGGFVDMDETSEQAAHRELLEETGIANISMRRLDVFDAVNRDPRGRTVTVAYVGFAEQTIHPKSGDDAMDARWFDVTALPPLAFDHYDIIKRALAF